MSGVLVGQRRHAQHGLHTQAVSEIFGLGLQSSPHIGRKLLKWLRTCHVGPTRGSPAHACFARQARAPAVLPRSIVLKGPGIMIVRHLHKVHELLAVLDQPAAEVSAVRTVLTLDGHFPSRRTWERRMAAIPDGLPAQIGCLGRLLIELIQPWTRLGRAVPIDSTVLRARGGVWHQKHRERGELSPLAKFAYPVFSLRNVGYNI